MIFLESPLPLADQRGTVRPIQGYRMLKRFFLAKVMKISLQIHMKFEYIKDAKSSFLAMIFLESPLPLADQRGTVRPIQGCRTLKRFLSAKMMNISLQTYGKFEYSKDVTGNKIIVAMIILFRFPILYQL